MGGIRAGNDESYHIHVNEEVMKYHKRKCVRFAVILSNTTAIDDRVRSYTNGTSLQLITMVNIYCHILDRAYRRCGN
jgi:hypothetical protein